MKLEHKEFGFDNFAAEMTSLHAEKHFDYLVTIIGEDFGEEGLGCIYILENTKTHERISVKQMAKKVGEEYVIPTVCNLWKIANLLEREVYDFYGIKFLGHPDMRRLFLRTDFQGYPLRKDFDMSPEANKFPCTDEPEDDFTVEYSLSADGHLVATEKRRFDDDEYVVNIGPNHPSTHGVLRLQTVIDGETVKRIYPHLGYIHRGIEKMWENMTYPQTLALTDRLNYLSAMMHRHALVGVIEEAMGIELSDRIRYRKEGRYQHRHRTGQTIQTISKIRSIHGSDHNQKQNRNIQPAKIHIHAIHKRHLHGKRNICIFQKVKYKNPCHNNLQCHLLPCPESHRSLQNNLDIIIQKTYHTKAKREKQTAINDQSIVSPCICYHKESYGCVMLLLSVVVWRSR